MVGGKKCRFKVNNEKGERKTEEKLHNNVGNGLKSKSASFWVINSKNIRPTGANRNFISRRKMKMVGQGEMIEIHNISPWITIIIIKYT